MHINGSIHIIVGLLEPFLCSRFHDKNFTKKLKLEGITNKDITEVKDQADYFSLSKLAIDYSDAVIKGSETINKDVVSYLSKLKKPVLEHQPEEQYIDAYSDFYDKILTE